MSEKTHWKKVVSDPNFIGEADFEPNEEKTATIKTVKQSVTVETAEGKSKKAVVYFAEPSLKPMILNVARSKSIEKVSGSAYFEDWPGTEIQLYIEHGIKAFGDVVSAVRVRKSKPAARRRTQLPPCSDCGCQITPAMGKTAEYLETYTLKHYGVALCADCATKRKEQAAKQGEEQQDADE